jgi:hypothetical protein
MSNALYALGRESFLKGEISWSGDNIKSVIVDSQEYTPNLATDQFLSDVPSGGRATNGTSANLTSKTTTEGSAGAANVTLTAVTGDISEYVVIYQDTGAEASSRLIALIDTATGLPVTPNGGDITIQWSTPIFTL